MARPAEFSADDAAALQVLLDGIREDPSVLPRIRHAYEHRNDPPPPERPPTTATATRQYRNRLATRRKTRGRILSALAARGHDADPDWIARGWQLVRKAESDIVKYGAWTKGHVRHTTARLPRRGHVGLRRRSSVRRSSRPTRAGPSRADPHLDDPEQPLTGGATPALPRRGWRA